MSTAPKNDHAIAAVHQLANLFAEAVGFAPPIARATYEQSAGAALRLLKAHLDPEGLAQLDQTLAKQPQQPQPEKPKAGGKPRK
jgi:hypothetical protein